MKETVTEQMTTEELLNKSNELIPPNPVKETRIEQVALDVIDPFPNHPYQVRDDKEMTQLAESIKMQGVVSPAIARKKEDGRYELISGHRRKHACELAGLDAMPVIVCELSDEQAAVAMVDSNCQREKVLPSEKAFAYKIKMEALKSQGKRSDLTSRPMVGKSDSADIVGADNGESGRQIQRYIRLNELIPPLLKMVDEGEMSFRSAVEISYLKKTDQKDLLSAMKREGCTPSLAQALKLKALAYENQFDSAVMLEIMQQQKGNQKVQVRIPKTVLADFLKRRTTTKPLPPPS